jgi:hypothetical protein
MTRTDDRLVFGLSAQSAVCGRGTDTSPFQARNVSTKRFGSAPDALKTSRRDDAVMTRPCPFSTGAVTNPAPGVPLRPGGFHPLATSNLRDPDRGGRRGARSSDATAFIRRSGALRSLRLALHVAPSAHPTGVRAVAPRLLAHLECSRLDPRRVRGGIVGRPQLRLRRRDADGHFVPAPLRTRVSSPLRTRRPLACERAAAGGLSRLASPRMGSMAADLARLRPEVAV